MNRDCRKDSFQPPVVGGSSLLVIFAVLCLTTFAVLALSSVKSNERLAEEAHKAVSEYYEADYEAEQILAQIRGGQLPEIVAVDENVYSYTCEISDNQELQVQIQWDGTDWRVLKWMAVSTAEWNEEDSSLNVWDGEDPSQ